MPPHPHLAVRAITAFTVLSPAPALASSSSSSSSWTDALSGAVAFLAKVASSFLTAGYAVQSLRVITNPFAEYLDCTSEASALRDLALLQAALARAEASHAALLRGVRIRFSIGAVSSARDLALVPALIRAAGDLANTCLNVPCDAETGAVDADLVLAGARVIAELGRTTPRGEGNFNFTINFNGPTLCPYFPAGFNTRESGLSFVVGLEYPALLVRVLEGLARQQPEGSSGDSGDGRASVVTTARARRDEWAAAAAAIRDAVNPHVRAVAGIARAVEAAQQSQQRYMFAGIDSSPAPSKSTESMCRVVELLGVDHFGASGTIECCAFLTRIFKSLGDGECPLVGFSGLMFAALEDRGLAAAAAKRQYGIGDLLVYSTCCGIGLDTVPVPGDTPPEKMAQLARDCGTLAFRLNKPLTVRLFPCEGLRAGDTTAFESDDLCNCRIFEVP